MQKLSEVMTRGKYVVAQVTAEHQLKKRLSEMGMVRGKVLTVITQKYTCQWGDDPFSRATSSFE